MYCYTDDTAYGCLFCSTGREKATAAELKRRYTDLEVLVPMKIRIWRHRGESREEQVVLFPGYIFFRARQGFDGFGLSKIDSVHKVLKSQENDWQLVGTDRIIVENFFETNGVIGLSKAYFEGDSIRIAEGYLKPYEGQILRVNRRAKTVQINYRFRDTEMLHWFGYEEIENISEHRAESI